MRGEDTAESPAAPSAHGQAGPPHSQEQPPSVDRLGQVKGPSGKLGERDSQEPSGWQTLLWERFEDFGRSRVSCPSSSVRESRNLLPWVGELELAQGPSLS